MSRAARALAACLLGLVMLLPGGATGCASFQAARLYASGTDALDAGRLEAAIADLERAAELRPEASEIQNHLGLAYRASGRDSDALRAFERAVALDCRNQAASHNLRLAELEARAAGAPR
jgi:Flp pilus assembly protein TadD